MRIRKTGISEDLYEAFYGKQVEMLNTTQGATSSDIDGRGKGGDSKYDKSTAWSAAVAAIMSRCHSSSQKTHIAKEAAELFWDGDFGDKLDQDKWTLCFDNGVVNLQTGEFRGGVPADYISKTTGIRYIPEDKMGADDTQTVLAEITDFMAKLFPDAPLPDYLWDHLASTPDSYAHLTLPTIYSV